MTGRDCSDSLSLLAQDSETGGEPCYKGQGSIGLIIYNKVKIRVKLLGRLAFPVVDLS
jgi:hypothetical protein